MKSPFDFLKKVFDGDDEGKDAGNPLDKGNPFGKGSPFSEDFLGDMIFGKELPGSGPAEKDRTGDSHMGNSAAGDSGPSEAYLQAESRYEAVFDDLQSEYEAVLSVLRDNRDNQPALTQGLAECEERLTMKLEAAQGDSAELEGRAADDMSGSDLEVLMKMMPAFMNAEKAEAAEKDVRARREGTIRKLQKELQQEEKAFRGDNAERIQRIRGCLEGLELTGDVFAKLGGIF